HATVLARRLAEHFGLVVVVACAVFLVGVRDRAGRDRRRWLRDVARVILRERLLVDVDALVLVAPALVVVLGLGLAGDRPLARVLLRRVVVLVLVGLLRRLLVVVLPRVFFFPVGGLLLVLLVALRDVPCLLLVLLLILAIQRHA